MKSNQVLLVECRDDTGRTQELNTVNHFISSALWDIKTFCIRKVRGSILHPVTKEDLFKEAKLRQSPSHTAAFGHVSALGI